MSKLFSQVGLAILCSLFMHAAMANPLRVSVEPGQIEGSVDVNLTNLGFDPVSLLLWDTPFEQTLSSNVFIIEKAVKGLSQLEVATYTGRSVKRSEVSAEHYKIIQPGEMISTNVVLNNYYDIGQFGEYSVRFAGDIHYEQLTHLQSRTKSAISAPQTLTHLQLISESTAVKLTPKLTPRLRPPLYGSCSALEQEDIVEAANIAEILTETALTDLTSLTAAGRNASPRYDAWFGAYSESRFNQVVTNFNAIHQAFENETLQFNCGCTESGIFAFVFPSLPYSITLCPSFWAASPNGQDSKAGTIIHELTHFTVVADTDDHVYGQSGARELAVSNPNMAIDNADSYEYFAENAPPLLISEAGSNTPITFRSLQLGVETAGTVAVGQTANFQVSNANRIELTSASGDADLYVYTDDQLSNEICVSTNGIAVADVCDLSNDGRAYIQVRGFSDAAFSLVAAGDEPAVPEGPDVLSLGVPVTASLAANTRHVYQLTGADSVELESLSGDADLTVFSDVELTAASVVCSSPVTASGSVSERCDIPNRQDTYYIAVVGFTNATYSLTGNVGPTADDDPAVNPATDPVSVGSSKSGAAGGFGLALLLLMVSLRVTRKG